ncbi:MAG: YbjN domain-containing protein [Propionibacteriaceae bacterium]|nr:YbjN domain-containing protein [Propionibacteriaceae bacterium]
MTISTDFDFDHSVDQAWRRFTLRLGEVLSMMDETEPLTLCPSDSAEHWYTRFFQEAKNHVTALVPLATGNDKLSGEQEACLASLNWIPGDEGYHMTVDQNHCDPLAQATVMVLRQVFGVTHPVFLDSNVLAEILQEPQTADSWEASGFEETLAHGSLDEVQLASAVAEEMSEVFGVVPMRDQDGDFAVRVGSTMIFVRIPSDGKEVRLFSVLVHDISGRSRAAEVLNDINAHARWVRFYLVRDKIIATMSVLASPFVPAHLRQAIVEMTNVADGVDDLLADSLQGKTTFPAEV